MHIKYHNMQINGDSTTTEIHPHTPEHLNITTFHSCGNVKMLKSCCLPPDRIPGIYYSLLPTIHYTVYTILPADFLGTRVHTAVSKDQMTATLLRLLRFYFLPRLEYKTAGHLIVPEDSNAE